MSVGKDQYTLGIQSAILKAREKALSALGRNPSGRKRLDGQTLAELRAVAPLKLRPCLIQRNKEGYCAAYLIQRIGVKGYRFLLRGAAWKICRAKKSALVILVKVKNVRKFEALAAAQEEVAVALEKVQEESKRRKR